MPSIRPLSFLALNFEPYFQAQVLTELENRGNSVTRTTSEDYGCCQLILCSSALIYLPPFDQRDKIQSFLDEQKSDRVNDMGLTPSFGDNNLYQQHFPRMHFESLMDVVVSKSCSEIANIIEKKLSS